MANYTEANEIVPGLWLGSAQAANDLAFLKRMKIGAVLNATSDLPFYHADPQVNREYTRIDVEDNLQPDQIERMYHFLNYATLFIHKNLQMQKKPVLVHCMMGMQRSACIVVAYLMKYYNLTLKQATTVVIKKRSVAFYRGMNFLQTLLWWEKALKRENK